jgi:hypothetical protein
MNTGKMILPTVFFIELANDIPHPIHSKHLYILFEWPLENNLIHKTREIEAYT